jgi:hypothetical protein
MLILIALLTGISDLTTLFLIFGISVISSYIFWIINDKELKKLANSALFKLGIFASVLSWLLIFCYAVGTIFYGDIRSPWYVYVAYIIGLFNSFIIVYASYWIKNNGREKKTITTETYPILVNQAIKVSLVLILIIGLKR